MAAAADFNFGNWAVSVSDEGFIDISYSGRQVLKGAYAETSFSILPDEEEAVSFKTGDVPAEVSLVDVEDCFGSGKSLTVSFAKAGATICQHLNFYTNPQEGANPLAPALFASLSIAAPEGMRVASNYMVPLASMEKTNPFNGSANRFITVPYDNDGHIRYGNDRVSEEPSLSFEVTAVYDPESRLGLVAGSVDHDKWKSGVEFGSYGKGYGMNHFRLVSGIANYLTRDVTEHGKVKGDEISSARFMVGMFDDWRVGLETFADANTMVVPRLEWDKGNPMGWSSWGVMMNYINYNGVLETAQWMRDNLTDLGFHRNDGKMVISLDSFAEDNLGSRIATLGNKIFSEGTYREGRETKQGLNMDLGLYGGPFVLWGWVLDSTVPGTGVGAEPAYKWSDVALRHNGELIKVGSNQAYAIDPTHPAIKTHIKWAFKKYADYGAKYVKIDFLNNGMCEGDSWYDPEITTGVMAYNYGMSLVREEAERYGMYIVESIAPLFPYQYAHARRQCCDRFSEIGESEYVMNAISNGWWVDRLYTVNDPDQLVLCKAGHNMQETMGENRARATSGMTSGAYIFGDNLSEPNTVMHDGEEVGYSAESRLRALEIMGNRDINDYVRENIGSFRPIDGGHPTTSTATSRQYSESLFMRDTERYLYVAHFNFEKGVFGKDSEETISYDRIGIEPSDVKSIKELWTGESIANDGDSFKSFVPKADARVYRIEKASWSGIEEIEDDEALLPRLTAFFTADGNCRVDAGREIESVAAYLPDGTPAGMAADVRDSNVTFAVRALPGSPVIIRCILTDGTTLSAKTIR